MTAPKTETDIGDVAAGVPKLPAIIRYYDDFCDSYIEIAQPDTLKTWVIQFDGRRVILDFERLDDQIRPLVKAWCANGLATLSPHTIEIYWRAIYRVPPHLFIALITSTPQTIRSFWRLVHHAKLPNYALHGLKSVLTFLCIFAVGSWSAKWLDLVSQLPLPRVDSYARVRTGDVFLSVEEEAAIVHHLDTMSARLQSKDNRIRDDELQASVALACSYQFGVRAKQIAMLEMRNIRIWHDGLEEHPSIHLTFIMIKQRSAKRVFPMLRRVKREWTPLFVELHQRAVLKGRGGSDYILGLTPEDVADLIANLTKTVCGTRRTVTELRHTAAQRLVDAGASEEELAAFMGHTNLDTGLIYFASSPSQAARVNQALGISETYQYVSKIARSRFISPNELAELKGDQQIGGVPHGIAITGIGGCSLGQPSCPYVPVMSCYGCRRFMPIAIAAVHLQALEDLREIMRLFYASSYAERGSPALQLATTISNVQAVLDELGYPSYELES
jgi:integrase